ncbi:MAG: HD domain-containing protein, partial [Paramuribaculum sp.]|nr:HD domain-containing protein [Paramuribaculum sp.]
MSTNSDTNTYNLTPEEEERLIEAEFQDVLNGYLKSNHRKKVEIIERAFRFAKKAHGGIRRRSGEPYILHPIAVAKIASQEIGLGSTSICAALLHDVVEDTDYTVEDIEAQFGKKIAQLVSGLTKISGGIFGDQASAQAENFRKLLLTMSEDIRVVLIKMADRLHNMRTLGSMAPNKQYKIAGETLYIYAPLAHRLGLFEIKTELEDLSFKYEHPKSYANIAELIRQSEARRSEVYNDFSAPIKERLDSMGLKYEAQSRLKSVYSIWRKMQTKHVPFEEVYDLYAMRIIFDCDDQSKEKEICWSIYSAITDLYRLHPDRTRDWISVPKANGYQALHLTVMGPDGNWIEVQIRSKRMDEIAEKGFAAHWKYKIGESDEESELNVWLRTIKDILDDPNPNAIDFLDTLKLNLFASEIVVFTPKGELIT